MSYRTTIMDYTETYDRHVNRLRSILDNVQRKTHLSTTELLVLSVFPFTVILGQLISWTSPSSTSPDALFGNEYPQINYYASKHNIVNKLFVKQGWLWTLAALGLYLFQHRGQIRSPLRTIARIASATLWWILFTQWCFGLPLMDRIFVATGGSCLFQEGSNGIVGGIVDSITGDTVSGSLQCRRLKGTWSGGHDPSGHVFLLTHGSLLIWFEVLELDFWVNVGLLFGKLRRATTWSNVATIVLTDSSCAILGILGLWWWMLLITAIHFHTIAERWSGLAFGVVGVLIYYLERKFIATRRRRI